MTEKKPSLEEIFAPRGVAVVGVTLTGNMFAANVFLGLKEAGFPAVYAVNPKHTEILGSPCYPDITSVPGEVDHAIVSIPAEASLAFLDECGRKGVKSAHFFTAGFSESGYRERAELEQAMLRKARMYGMRIIGPNSTGLFVPRIRLVNGRRMPLTPGAISFLSQSGGHGHNLPWYGGPRGLRFSKVISYGNGLDIDESELLDFFARDPETGIIAAYIEGVKDGQRFRAALAAAAAVKPIVIYKGGTTESGRRTAFGHTASISSAPATFNALCRQLNVITVDSLEDMIDALCALQPGARLGSAPGFVVMGAGGGPSVYASDEMEKVGLRVPALSGEVQDELKKVLPFAGGIFGNPIDAHTLTEPRAIIAAANILSRVPGIDAFVYHLGFHPISQWGNHRFDKPAFLEPLIAGFDELRQKGKLVLVAICPAPEMHGMDEFFAAQEAFGNAGLPVFNSLHSLAVTMSRLVAWHRAKAEA